MSFNWAMWDRIRLLNKTHRLYQNDRTIQDQTSLSTIGRDLGINNLRRSQLSADSLFATQTNRFARYRDYEMMDHGELALALDIHAQESCITDPETGHSLIIKASSSVVKKELEELFFNTLNWDSVAYAAARYLCKYGDNPFEIIPTVERDGVAAIKHIEVREFTRLETRNGDLIGFFYSPELATNQPVFMHPWRMVHMRLDCLEKDFKPYGMSIIDRSRSDAKRVRLVSEGAIIYRLTRATERKKFKIPIGNIPAKEIPEYLNVIARAYKRKRIFDPRTGTFDEKYSPLIQEDDFFLPQRPDGQGIDIDNLPGGANLDKIDDLEYFKKQMIAPTNIPPAMLGVGEGAGQPTKEPLYSISYHFARSIERVQRAIALGLKKIAIVHLLLRGYSINDVKNVDLYLPIGSAIEELYRMETWQTRVSVMADLKDLEWFPKEWIVTKFTDLTPDEIIELNEMIKMMGADPAAVSDGSGGGGGGGGGLPDIGDPEDALADVENLDQLGNDLDAAGDEGLDNAPAEMAAIEEDVRQQSRMRKKRQMLKILSEWHMKKVSNRTLASGYNYMNCAGEFRLITESKRTSDGEYKLLSESVVSEIDNRSFGYNNDEIKMITKVATILYRNNKKQVPGALVTESVDIAALNEVIAGDKILIKSNI